MQIHTGHATEKSETIMRIALLPSAAAQKPALAELLQLYRSDLSDFNGTTKDIQECHAPIGLHGITAEDSQQLFLLCAGDAAVGFALIDRRSRRQLCFDGYSVVDLFVKRSFRRQGFGRAGAIALFNRFPGAWEVSTCAVNVPGQIFWRGVVDRYTNGRYAETWIQTPTWRGPVQSFFSPAR
jgi:predicted acetyltransferase